MSKYELLTVKSSTYWYIRYGRSQATFIFCEKCLPNLESFNSTQYFNVDVNNKNILTNLPECNIDYCCQCDDEFALCLERYILFGNYFGIIKICRPCFCESYNNPTCDCQENNNIFKTICEKCLEQKFKEMQLCTLNYPQDVIKVILIQLMKIKFYFEKQ